MMLIITIMGRRDDARLGSKWVPMLHPGRQERVALDGPGSRA